MRTTTTVVFFNAMLLQLAASTLVLDSTRKIDHPLWNTSEQIQKYCFNPTTSLIIFSDVWMKDEKELLTSLSAEQIPSYVFGKDVNETLEKHQRFRHVYKLEPIHVQQRTYPATSITIFIPKDIDFLALMTNLKNSIWWNSRAKYLLVNSNAFGCGMAQTILPLIWSFNVLSVIYMCWNQENQLALYTFNPYSHSAPKFWTPVAMMADMNKEWTLFQHTYQQIGEFSLMIEDATLCSTLYFDKLQNMNGYSLKLLADNEVNRREICKLNYFYKTLCSVIESINSTVTLKIFKFNSFLNPDGKPYNDIQEIISGTVDLLFDGTYLRDFWWLQSYPYLTNEIKIVTPIQRGYMFNFYLIFKPATWLFLILLCILSILSLKYILGKNPTVEFVRVFVNTATLREPESKFKRVCFIFLIYMWLIINVYIQSNYQADKIAIKQNPIDSMEDLIKSNFTIYGLPSYSEFIANNNLRNRFVGEASFKKCLEFSSTGNSVACLISIGYLKTELPANAPVHISKGNVLERAVAYLFSEDSPLISKYNSIMSKLNQAGIIKFYYELDDLVFRRNVLRDIDHQVDQAEIIIALRILFWGWILSLAIFTLELVVTIVLNHMKSF